MTRKTKFEDAFWGQDFCSSAGFDAILKRMKDGRTMCKDFEQFLKNRARVEEEYSKQLAKVARSAGGITESGTLRSSWECLRQQTDRIASEHLEASKAIAEAAVRVAGFMEKQKGKKKQAEEAVVDGFKRKVNLFKKTGESRKTYEAKCRELEQAEHQKRIAKQQGSTILQKEAEKIFLRCAKLQTDTTKADASYKANVDLLEQARLHWEKEMTNACRIMEQLEDDRLVFTRNEMWVHTNILSKTWVDNDDHSESVRISLEKCDVDKDISEFISERMTGFERPAGVPYEPYSGSGGGGSSSSHASHFPPGDRRGATMGSRPPQPLPGSDRGRRGPHHHHHHHRSHGGTPSTGDIHPYAEIDVSPRGDSHR